MIPQCVITDRLLSVNESYFTLQSFLLHVRRFRISNFRTKRVNVIDSKCECNNVLASRNKFKTLSDRQTNVFYERSLHLFPSYKIILLRYGNVGLLKVSCGLAKVVAMVISIYHVFRTGIFIYPLTLTGLHLQSCETLLHNVITLASPVDN